MNQINLLPDATPNSPKGQRVENDYYPTPEPLTKILLAQENVFGIVLEPCAGHGAIANVLRQHGKHTALVFESDLNYGDNTLSPRDATQIDFWDYWKGETIIDWVITNPPFNPVNPRPQFRRNTKGTDSSTVAWFIWRKDWSWEKIGVKCPFIFEWGWRS